jgi:hypothetical protein
VPLTTTTLIDTDAVNHNNDYDKYNDDDRAATTTTGISAATAVPFRDTFYDGMPDIEHVVSLDNEQYHRRIRRVTRNFDWMMTALQRFLLCAFVWNQMWGESFILVLFLVLVAGVAWMLGQRQHAAALTHQHADRPHVALTTTGLRYDHEHFRFGTTILTTVLVRVVRLSFVLLHPFPSLHTLIVVVFILKT